MANQRGLDRPNRRTQQMKRELIGLVIGSVFLLTGTAFLFNHTLNSSDASVADNKSVSPPTAEPKPAVLAQAVSLKDAPATTVAQPATMIVSSPPTPPASAQVATAVTSVATPPEPSSPPIASVNDRPVATAPSITVNPQATVAPDKVSPPAVTAPAANPPPVTPPAPATVTAEAKPKPVVTAPSDDMDKTSKSSGWIYAGQFADGHWVEKGLVIGNELPVAGQTYALGWGATLRAAPPGKNTGVKNSVIKGSLGSGKKISVLQVKQSGDKGHIWLEVAQ